MSKEVIYVTKLYLYNFSENCSSVLLVCFFNPSHLNIFISY